MLGFRVSQATISRYLATQHRYPGQSWRAFIRNQALGLKYSEEDFGHQDCQNLMEYSYPGEFMDPLSRS